MAEYTEKVYASDSWVDEYAHGTHTGTTRGASLTASARFSFLSDGFSSSYYADSHSEINLKFLYPSKYKKKSLTSAILYAYITGYSGSGSGNLPEGRFVYILGSSGFIWGPVFNKMTGEDAGYELRFLNKNQYNEISGERSFSPSDFGEGYLVFNEYVSAGSTGNLYKNTQYDVRDSMTMQSHTGANKPYVIFTYSDVVPRVMDCAPKSGFVNEQADTVFRWRFYAGGSNVQQPVQQQGYQFRWRVTGQSAYQESTVTSGAESHTVPAGTFPAQGGIDWCVRVQSDDGIWSEWSSWMTLTTVDSKPTATPISPVDAYVDGSKDAVFRWRHSVSTGTPQSEYMLQYSSDSGQSWIDLARAATSQTSVVIPANTFPPGRLIWRVCTANSDGAWSNWSSPANIIVRAAPQQPVLGVSQVSPRPLFAWQSTGQSSWRIAIYQNGEEIYDTGEVPGDDRRFRMPEYLPNGAYEARLWVKNLYELQSQAAVVTFTIEMEEVSSPQLGVQAEENKAVLLVSGGGFWRYYIFRDGIMVHKLDSPGMWEDYAACGNHTYWVRGVMPNDAFADSGRVRIWVPVLFAQLSDTEDLTHPIPLKRRRGEYPILEGEVMPQGKSTFYAGRRYPLYEFSENLSEPLSMRFSYGDRMDFERLAQLVRGGRSLLYRDYRGERRYLAITGVSYTVDAVSWDFSLSTERVDYVEAIPYDPPEGEEE